MTGEKNCEVWEFDRSIRETQRLNRGSRLVPGCNSTLIYGTYWILHHLSQFLSLFFLLHTLLCLSDSIQWSLLAWMFWKQYCQSSIITLPMHINLPSTVLSFVISLSFPPFSQYFSSAFHLLMPHCLLSSWAFSVFSSHFQYAMVLFRWVRLKFNAWNDITTLFLH